jgi:hypothetical protein
MSDEKEDLRYVRSRTEYAVKDIEAVSAKLLSLLIGVEIDRSLWEEITLHLADCQSHLGNALDRLPENEEPEKIDWETLVRGETLRPF